MAPLSCSLSLLYILYWYCFRINELQDQLVSVQDQLNQVSTDLQHLHGERSEKYKELKKREESMKGRLLKLTLYL